MNARYLSAAALVAALGAALYGPIAWAMFVLSGDFRFHLNVARQLYETGRPTVPHFLFHGLTAASHAVLPATSFVVAGAVVIAATYFLTGSVTYALYWRAFRDSRFGTPWMIALVSMAILLAQPITMAQSYTLGYLWPEPFHSPTYTMLKPFALAGFAWTGWFLAHRQSSNLGLQALFAAITIAGALSKPNFVIAVLPAAALLMAYRLSLGLQLSIRPLLAGLFAPAAAILAWQFLVAFASEGGESGMYQDSVSWAPLKFMSHWATGLPAKFVASTLFPLTVAALYWPLVRREVLMQFAWLCFGFGALYGYGLVETRNWHTGNFVWSGYITLFTLFVATSIFWLRQAAAAEGRWALARAVICGAALALHVASGVRLIWLYLTRYGCRADLPLGFVCS